MSYDIDIFIGEGHVPSAAYERFVRCNSVTHGTWSLHERIPLDEKSKHHEFCVADEQDILGDHFDVERCVRVWFDLCENTPDDCPLAAKEYFWRLNVETNAGRNLLACVIQLSVPVLAFDLLGDVIVEDIQCGVSGEPEIFRTRASWRRHAANVLKDWYDTDTLLRKGFIDNEGLSLVLPESSC